jgi:Ca-activated chloride channel family protein
MIALAVMVWAGGADAITLRDDVHANLARGNKYYDAGEHDKALQRYQEAEGLDSTSAVPHFNAGDALFRLGNYKDGAMEFLKSAASETDSIKSMSYYNLGNTMYKANDLQSAVEAYKRSLLINPDDQDAKYNLELALRVKDQKEQQSQQQQNQKDQKKQDQQNQEQGQKDQDRQQQQQKDQQQQQQQQQGEQQQDQMQQEQGQQAQQQEKPPEISAEELQRILAAVEASDKKTQEEMMEKPSKRKITKGKDW